MKSSYSENLFLWTGKKHSGKTTALNNLVRLVQSNGFKVGGILAPSRYEKDKLLGFDIVDINTGQKAILSNIDYTTRGPDRFVFEQEAKLLGQKALDSAKTGNTDLIIIDEFGPLELMGGSWKKEINEVISSSRAMIIIVSRQELIEKVSSLLHVPPGNILTSGGESEKKVIEFLKRNQNVRA